MLCCVIQVQPFATIYVLAWLALSSATVETANYDTETDDSKLDKGKLRKWEKEFLSNTIKPVFVGSFFGASLQSWCRFYVMLDENDSDFTLFFFLFYF